MTNSTRSFIVLSAVLAAGLAVSARQSAPPPPLAPLVLPAGFRAEVFADKVENARSLANSASRNTRPTLGLSGPSRPSSVRASRDTR